MPVVLLLRAVDRADAFASSHARCRAAEEFEPLVSEPEVCGCTVSGLLSCEPGDRGVADDCPGVGAGAGPVPFGMRLSVWPVPGVPEVDGKVNDCPGVGAGVGPVPLGTELPEVPGDVPPVVPVPVPPVVPPPPPVPPLVPPLCASDVPAVAASNAAAARAVSDFGGMRASPLSPFGINVASVATFRALF